MLRCEKLHFSYGPKKALENISITFPSAGMVGILGHNGSGKSTLLKILSGVLISQGGILELDGKSMLTSKGTLAFTVKKQLGIVLQETSSDEKLTVEENLLFYARLMGLSREQAKARVKENIVSAHLSAELNTTLKKLSGGTRRRVELYRAFLHHPRLLILDEPTAGLDAKERERFFIFVKEYIENHHALVLFSSHNTDDFSRCDDVIMMHKGQIVMQASPADILHLTQPFLLEVAKSSHEKQGTWLNEEMLEEKVIHAIKDGQYEAFSVRRAQLADVYEAKVRKINAIS